MKKITKAQYLHAPHNCENYILPASYLLTSLFIVGKMTVIMMTLAISARSNAFVIR